MNVSADDISEWDFEFDFLDETFSYAANAVSAGLTPTDGRFSYVSAVPIQHGALVSSAEEFEIDGCVSQLHPHRWNCSECSEIRRLQAEVLDRARRHGLRVFCTPMDYSEVYATTVAKIATPNVPYDERHLRAAAEFTYRQNPHLYGQFETVGSLENEFVTEQPNSKYIFGLSVGPIEKLARKVSGGLNIPPESFPWWNKIRDRKNQLRILFSSHAQACSYRDAFYKILHVRFGENESLRSYGHVRQLFDTLNSLQNIVGKKRKAPTEAAPIPARNELHGYLIGMLECVRRQEGRLLYLRMLMQWPARYLRFTFLPFSSATEMGTEESRRKTAYGAECTWEQLQMYYQQIYRREPAPPVEAFQIVRKSNLDWTILTTPRYFVNYPCALGRPSFGREFFLMAEAQCIQDKRTDLIIFYSNDRWVPYGSSGSVTIEMTLFEELRV